MDPLQAALLFGSRDRLTNGAPRPRPRRTSRIPRRPEHLVARAPDAAAVTTARQPRTIASAGGHEAGPDEARSNSPNSSIRPRSSIVATVRLSISAIHRWPRSLVRSSVPAITTAMIHT